MEPVTHALAAVALGRAGLERLTPRATPMLLVAALAPDVDLLSRLAGAEAYLVWRRTATHSLLGTAVIALAVAAAFWWFGRKRPKRPVRFAAALAVSLAGAAAHLLLDLANSHGAQLLWPLDRRWFAGDLLEAVDPWVLLVLLGAVLLPALFRLVSEEIGARSQPRGARRGAIVALVLLAGYAALRVELHGHAIERLNAVLYNGAAPLAAAAFPLATSPFLWRGVVETEGTLETLELDLSPGGRPAAERRRTHFKPEDSPVLEAAQQTAAARRFLAFARFPAATVYRLPDGHRVELRDLRLAPSAARPMPVAVIEMDDQRRVLREEIRFARE